MRTCTRSDFLSRARGADRHLAGAITQVAELAHNVVRPGWLTHPASLPINLHRRADQLPEILQPHQHRYRIPVWRSPAQTDIVEIPRGLLDCLTDMLAYAT